MSIKKTKNGTYQLRVYIPEDTQSKLGLGKLYEKRFKTRREAKEAELKLSVDIEKARHNKHFRQPLKKEDILFLISIKRFGSNPIKLGKQLIRINLLQLQQSSKPKISLDYIFYPF